ncbi:hypothetical protein [Spiribacter pallidus]|uniref:Pilus assembly protein n=1 Tax=Spiribacter pallidus TaxID=1987936 RepID=A0ABV3TCH5_9GAMM
MNRQGGAALTEAILCLMALLPALWAVDWLADLHGAQLGTQHAVRISSWGQALAGVELEHYRANDPAIPVQRRPMKSDQQSNLEASAAVRALAHGDYVPGIARIGGLHPQMLRLPQPALQSHHAERAIKPTTKLDEHASTLSVEASASVVSVDWRARRDRQYQSRTEGVVASEPLDAATRPGRGLARFVLFREGRDADATDFIPPSGVQPKSPH